jgi:hypothetical protein
MYMGLIKTEVKSEFYFAVAPHKISQNQLPQDLEYGLKTIDKRLHVLASAPSWLKFIRDRISWLHKRGSTLS